MPNNSERFRNEFLIKLTEHLSPEQVNDVLKDFDITSLDYDIMRKPMELITIEEIPEAVKWFIASKSIANCSEGTLKTYSDRLINFFNIVQKPFTDVDPTDIRCYLYHIKTTRHVSDSHIDGIRRILNSFFGWLVKNGHLIRNPCGNVEPTKFETKAREPFTPYEIETIRWSCKNIREIAIVDFLYSTGCRVSEFIDVRQEDINWQERSIIVRKGKGRKRRIIFFNARSEFTLRKYLDTRNDDCEYLFATVRRPYRQLQVRSLQTVLNKIGERCNMHIHPHRFRHSFATQCIRNDMPITQLQVLMGHDKPETTMIYAKLDLSDIKRSHQKAYA